MPIYCYECQECLHIEEVFSSEIKSQQEDIAVVTCPKCNTLMKRIMSLSDFKMKGAPPRGWQPLKKSNPKSYVKRYSRSDGGLK